MKSGEDDLLAAFFFAPRNEEASHNIDHSLPGLSGTCR